MDRDAIRPPLDGRSEAADARRLPSALPAIAAALALLAGLAVAAPAQTVGPPAKRNNNTYGSPLDTLKSSHLWTDTPVPKDFVRESRPAAAALDYAPLTGTDPERPKPRDAANVAALQAEMERAAARLAGRPGRPHPSPRRSARASSGKPRTTSEAGAGSVSRDGAAATQ